MASVANAKGKAKAQKSTLAAAYLHKKLQGVVAVKVWTSLTEGKQSDESVRQSAMADAFFGRNGRTNEVAELLAGNGEYAVLWEDVNGRKFLNSQLSGGLMLESGVAFTEDSLRRKNKAGGEIQGSTLAAAATKNVREAKKMLAFYNSYVDSKGRPPSGDSTPSGALQYVLSKYTGGKEDGDDGAGGGEGEGDEDDDDGEGPPAAFFVFFVFGPHVKKEHQSSFRRQHSFGSPAVCSFEIHGGQRRWR